MKRAKANQISTPAFQGYKITNHLFNPGGVYNNVNSFFFNHTDGYREKGNKFNKKEGNAVILI